AKRKEREKNIKSLTKTLDNLHAKVARLSAALNQAIVLEAEKNEEILRLKATPSEFASFFCGQFQDLVRKLLASDEFSRLEPKKLARQANVSTSRNSRVSPHITKDSTVTPAFKSLELSTNDDLTHSIVASKHNEEMVNAEGISIALEDAVDLVDVGSRCASSIPNDVVVSLFADEKGDGLVPSFAAGEEADANPSWV
nr:hypothetical protein [Tanacetum cinerariifolium]